MAMQKRTRSELNRMTKEEIVGLCESEYQVCIDNPDDWTGRFPVAPKSRLIDWILDRIAEYYTIFDEEGNERKAPKIEEQKPVVKTWMVKAYPIGFDELEAENSLWQCISKEYLEVILMENGYEVVGIEEYTEQ